MCMMKNGGGRPSVVNEDLVQKSGRKGERKQTLYNFIIVRTTFLNVLVVFCIAL